MKINVQASYDNKFPIDVELGYETPQLKEIISSKIPDCHPSELKLIYSGRILKDADSIESIKMKENNTLHVVRSATKKTVAPAASATTPEPTTIPSASSGRGSSPTVTSTPLQTSGSTMPNMANFQSMFGSSSQANFDPSQIAAQMNPEQMRPLMDMMMANPELLKASMAMNPEFQNYPPHVQEMLSKPEFIKVLMELQMAQMGGNFASGSSAAMMGGAGANSGASAGQNDYMSTLASMMSGSGAQSPLMQQASTPAEPLEAPEIRFASQLQQLQEMGFYDPDANIRALLACGGNVNLAVERLFQQQ